MHNMRLQTALIPACIFRLTYYARKHTFAGMDAIKQARRTLGATQAQLADMLGINQSTVSRMESGALEVDPRTALALEALVARSAMPAQAAA